SVIRTHAPRAQGSEVAWALWAALAWKVSLTAETAKEVAAMNDDVVALLALDANQRGLFPIGSLDTSAWQTLVAEKNVLNGEHWLLAYEANAQGWLHVPAVNQSAPFAAMHAADVTFYDPTQH